MSDAMILRSPLDMHLHLRQGDMLRHVAPLSARTFAGAVVMPNLVPPVDTPESVKSYRTAILDACGDEQFEPYMTMFFRPFRPEVLLEARDHVLGIKLYPAGVTTNSEDGVFDIRTCTETFRTMEELGLPLMVHGESHGFVMDREREFLREYRWLAETFPELTIVMEHITTADAVHLLDEYPNLHATVTLHHLLITLDDMAGGKLKPHLFCKPVAKRPEDREALRRAVLGGHPDIMFGSDSAPHPVSSKECAGCAAGVFTAPHAIAMLVELFMDAGCPERLQGFLSDHARRIYGITPPDIVVTVEHMAEDIPGMYDGEVVPFRAGETLPWRVTGKRRGDQSAVSG